MRRRRARRADPTSQGLPGPSGSAPQSPHLPPKVRLGLEQALEVALELLPPEGLRVQPVETRPPRQARRNELVPFQGDQRLLNARQVGIQHPCEFPRVRFRKQVERKECSRTATASKRARRLSDLHRWSYDHLWRS